MQSTEGDTGEKERGIGRRTRGERRTRTEASIRLPKGVSGGVFGGVSGGVF